MGYNIPQQTSEGLIINADQMKVALEEGAQHFRESVTHTKQSFSDMAHSVATSSEDLTAVLGDSVNGMKQSV